MSWQSSQTHNVSVVPGNSPLDLQPEPFRVLVTLGESTTAGGWSSNPNRCWAPVLASLISDFQDKPVRLINSGIGANVISARVPSYHFSGKPAAIERVENHVVQHQPDLLVISYGLNDARGGTPAELFRQELVSLIGAVRAGCSPLIVLLSPYFMTDFSVGGSAFAHGSQELFQIFTLLTQQVAISQGCLFCDVYHAYGNSPWMVHGDGVHANDLGHRLVAHTIFQVLAQNCSGLALRTKRLESTSERWRDESTLRADYGY